MMFKMILSVTTLIQCSKKDLGRLFLVTLIALFFSLSGQEGLAQNFICDSQACRVVGYDEFRANAAKSSSFQKVEKQSDSPVWYYETMHSFVSFMGHFLPQKSSLEFDMHAYEDLGLMSNMDSDITNFEPAGFDGNGYLDSEFDNPNDIELPMALGMSSPNLILPKGQASIVNTNYLPTSKENIRNLFNDVFIRGEGAFHRGSLEINGLTYGESEEVINYFKGSGYKRASSHPGLNYGIDLKNYSIRDPITGRKYRHALLGRVYTEPNNGGRFTIFIKPEAHGFKTPKHKIIHSLNWVRTRPRDWFKLSYFGANSPHFFCEKQHRAYKVHYHCDEDK